MASGIYAQLALTANTNNPVHITGPTLATYNIRLINTTANEVLCGLAFAATATPTAGEWVAPLGGVIPAYGMLEEQAIPIQAGKYIIAYPGGPGINAAIWGME